MKNVIVVLAVVLISGAAYGDVNISCSSVVDSNTAQITVSYESTEVNSLRAFAVDISLDGDANIVDVNCVNGDFIIYPGSVNIAGDGTVNEDGSCLCDASLPETLGGLDTKGITIEMASMHVGSANAPPNTGELIEFTVLGVGSADISIATNAIRGGVVMEDPNEAVTVNLMGLIGIDLGGCCSRPSCWDASKCAGQPFGDGDCSGAINLGDLFALKAAFGKNAPWTDVACCSDYNQSGGVNLADLFVLKANFGSTGYAPSTGNQDCPPP